MASVKRIPRRTLLWSALFAIAAGVLVVLLVLIGFGYLALPKSPPPSVTVSEVQWTIQQGTTPGGGGWFGPSHFNYSLNAEFPLTVSAGTSFRLAWTPENFDTTAHTVYSLSVSVPFEWNSQSSRPPLPDTVPSGDDGGQFSFVIITPSTPGTYELNVTVNAINGG